MQSAGSGDVDGTRHEAESECQDECGGGADATFDVLLQKFECPSLLLAGGLFDGSRQPCHLAANLVGRQDADARGQNRGFEHGVLGPIEAEEVADRRRWPRLRTSIVVRSV